MHKLYSVAEIRAIEEAASTLLPAGTLMQRAGQAAAALAQKLVAGQTAPRVLVLAGPGNNGGDALVVADILDKAGIDVLTWKIPGPAPLDAIADQKWSLLIDGMFGIGLSRQLSADAKEAATKLSALDCPVLALDVPSGLDADTGNIVGADGFAMRATHTITFIGDKPGLHTCDGRDMAGIVSVAALDIDGEQFVPEHACLNEVSLFAHCLQGRQNNSHKGSYGEVAVIGGEAGMAGAAVLAGRAALLGGAGRVYLCMLDAAVRYDSQQPELMFRDAHGFEMDGKILVAGPGLGMAATSLVARVLDSTVPIVLDADALNLVAASTVLQDQLCQRYAATILTPHPLEAARLLGMSASGVQADRLQAARALAQRFNAYVVLKGSGSVMARPDGEVVINTTGNPGLATAGTGDVLAGLCGSLLAQGWPAWEALLGAVWMHGSAADQLVNDHIGPVGLTASELIPAARSVLNALIRRGPQQL
jgi:hydroxyethylthiazole kinase-like uncharacterized protein yjeF